MTCPECRESPEQAFPDSGDWDAILALTSVFQDELLLLISQKDHQHAGQVMNLVHARVEELRAPLQLASELECFGAYDVAKGLAIKDADDFVGLGGYSCLILQATKVR